MKIIRLAEYIEVKSSVFGRNPISGIMKNSDSHQLIIVFLNNANVGRFLLKLIDSCVIEIYK